VVVPHPACFLLSGQQDPTHDPIPPELIAHQKKVAIPPTKIQKAMVAMMRFCLSVSTRFPPHRWHVDAH
jgi:hypothetical protein